MIIDLEVKNMEECLCRMNPIRSRIMICHFSQFLRQSVGRICIQSQYVKVKQIEKPILLNSPDGKRRSSLFSHFVDSAEVGNKGGSRP